MFFVLNHCLVDTLPPLLLIEDPKTESVDSTGYMIPIPYQHYFIVKICTTIPTKTLQVHSDRPFVNLHTETSGLHLRPDLRRTRPSVTSVLSPAT